METKQQLAWRYRVSVRTVDRWQACGLMTRTGFGSIRMNPNNADDWIKLNIGLVPGASAPNAG